MRISDWSSEVCSSDLPRLPGLADAGRILRRNPGAVEDRFPLREQIGLLLAERLFGRHPLHRLGVGRAFVGDDDPPRAAEPDRARGAVDRIARADLIRQRRAVRSEEHTSETQSLMSISSALFRLKKKITQPCHTLAAKRH